MEIAELRGRRKNDIDKVKAFLSRRCDRARLAWGRLPTEMQRQCVFFSSTNDVKFLKDRTGNRRYWPAFDVKFNISALARDVHQLWAEAAAAEAQDESIRLPEELWAIAEAVQGESLEEEPWVEVLDTALGGLEGKIRSADVWVILGIEPHMRTSEGDNRMGAAMRELGWERKQRRYGRDPEWGYVKGNGQEPIAATRDPVTKDVSVYQGQISRTIVNGGVTETIHDGPITSKDLRDTPF